MRPNNEHFEQWLNLKRSQRAPASISDDVMRRIADGEFETPPQVGLGFGMVDWIDRSRIRKVCACGAALAVGCVPILYLAYVARFIGF